MHKEFQLLKKYLNTTAIIKFPFLTPLYSTDGKKKLTNEWKN